MDVRGVADRRDRLWDAAQRAGGAERLAGLSELGARALGVFLEGGAGSVLVLGCGRDADSEAFAREGLCVVTVDFSSIGLDVAGRPVGGGSPQACGGFLAQNIRDRLPEPRSSVDAVYSTLLLCMDLQGSEVEDVMWQSLRVLRPGGLMVFSVHSDRDPRCGLATKCGEDEWKTDRGFVAHFFTEDKVRRVARGFVVLWIREYEQGADVLYEAVLMKL